MLVSWDDLERFDEFRRKQACFFGEVLRADPIIRADGFVRLAKEPGDFLDEVFLRGAELLSIRHLQILFCCGDIRRRIVLRPLQVPR